MRLLICAIPVIWISLFYLFVLRAFSKLGKMPIYDLPDPKDLGYTLHHVILFFGIPVCLLAILIYPIITFFSRKIQPVKFKEILLYGIGVLLFIIQVYIDPFKLQIWFTD